MFLTAVLQGHTDSRPANAHDDATPASDALEDTSVKLERLEQTLAVPAKERVQPLPSIHRSRWV